MDALAKYRVTNGERAISLDLGAILGYGVLAGNTALRDRLLTGGILAGVYPSQMFGLLDYYCNPNLGLLSTEECQVAVGVAPPSQLRNKAQQDPAASINLPIYSRMLGAVDEGEDTHSSGQPATSYRRAFLTANSIAKAGEVVARALVQKMVASHVGVSDISDADTERPMHDFGVDSLMAIELRTWFAK